MAAMSHDVVPIERCLIMHPLLQDLYDAMDLELPGLKRFSLRAGIHTAERMVIFEMENDEPPDIEVTLPVSCVMQMADGTPVTLMGSPYLHETLGQYTYRISAPSFFQVNTLQAERMVEFVCAQFGQDLAGMIDAYCGVGTFSLAMASRTKRLVGIEGSASALEDARVNALGLDHLSFLEGAVEDVLPTLEDDAPAVLLDPPREGLDPRALAALLHSSPQRIVYVSCDPATLARDVKGLLAGGYLLTSVTPFDMFPQTFHVETVAVLDRA
jgi:23S rRNA (uracil1939-C5)-methyltransferase